MGLLTISGLAFSLAMDAFSVCVAAGVKIEKPTYRHYFRLAFHFGLFQFFMPVIGFYGGTVLQNIISAYDHWIAFGLLVFIGIKMIWDSLKKNSEEDNTREKDPSRGLTLVVLSIATSIDAAAVGFSFAALHVPIFKPAVIIGIVCMLCSAAGLYIGNKIGGFAGKWAERAGGLILMVIGVKILIEHLG